MNNEDYEVTEAAFLAEYPRLVALGPPVVVESMASRSGMQTDLPTRKRSPGYAGQAGLRTKGRNHCLSRQTGRAKKRPQSTTKVRLLFTSPVCPRPGAVPPANQLWPLPRREEAIVWAARAPVD
jgi:hypothetical protein